LCGKLFFELILEVHVNYGVFLVSISAMENSNLLAVPLGALAKFKYVVSSAHELDFVRSCTLLITPLEKWCPFLFC
jgi:hypothetical protein